jgi:hypothetical protein
MRTIRGRVGALATALIVLGAGSQAASAATLKASYRLDGSRASQVPGAPDLVDIGPGNQFKTEQVDGVARQVLAFPKGGGVSLATKDLVDPTSHSIVMVFRLKETDGYRRLLDFRGGASDDGLYQTGGQLSLYGGDYLGFSPERLSAGAYVQVALTSEATLAGTQWTTLYVDGSPVVGATTPQGFTIGAAGLRFFKDNVRNGDTDEQSAGALACVLVYDGALTVAEAGQLASDPSGCPAPSPAPAASLPYKTGTYRGTTSQGLPITFTVERSAVTDISFRWRAKCADGRVHSNGIGLGGTAIRGKRFSVRGLLMTGGRARVFGLLDGGRAEGTLSRWAGSAFGTNCRAMGITWRAHRVQAGASLLGVAALRV